MAAKNPAQNPHIIIVGGGFAGVELAGAIAEIAHQTLKKEFRGIDPRTTRVVLVEGGAHLLMAFPGSLGENAKKELERLGVEVRLQTAVTDVMYDGVLVAISSPQKQRELISAANIFWAAGNAASTLLKTLGTPLDRAGRAIVREDLSLAAYPEICVLGDAAHCLDPQTNAPLPTGLVDVVADPCCLPDWFSQSVCRHAALDVQLYHQPQGCAPDHRR